MNNFLKTAFVAAGVVGTVGAVSTADAASLNVVVDKIEIFTDNSDISTGVTVYDPANSVGESATRTIDLFNSTQKLGTALQLATPPANTYETVLLHISEIEVSGSTVASDIRSTLNTLGIGQTAGSNLVLPLGTVTNGGQLDLAYGGTLDTKVIPAVPFTVSGRGFTLPKLNISMDSSLINDSATTAAELVGTFPTISTVAASTADNADLTNLLLTVNVHTAWNAAAAASATSGFVSATTPLKVGLFAPSMPERPLQVETLTTTDTATAATKTVEFVDVVQANVVPVVWVDSDSDNKLDAGEYFSVAANLPVAIASVDEDISGISPVGGVGSTISGSEVALGAIDGVAGAFGPRTVTLKMALADDTNQSAGSDGYLDSAIFDTDIALTTGASNTIAHGTGASVTVAYQVATGVSRSVEFATVVGGENAGAGPIANGENISFALDDVTAFDAVPGFTYVSSTTVAGSLTIAGIPLAIVTLQDGNNIGTYDADIQVRNLVDIDGDTVAAANHTLDEVGGSATTSANPTAGVVSLGAGAAAVVLAD